jgi:GTP-binding protein HflX
LSDTVGFIRKLPHHLVAAFRATLEEVREADLLLHVIDASSRNMEEQIEAVDSVLKELEVPHIPVISVYNKIDRLEDPSSFRKTFWNRRDGIAISALKREGITELLEKIEENLYICRKDMALQIKSRTASLT